ncbi:MAG: nucleotidyltransferase substrate binding protein [Magnetospirillum sp. WYHS-4]
MTLYLEPLEKALASLDRGLVRFRGAPGDEELRDARIQRFEYSFELCWKLLKRRLEMDLADAGEVDGYSKRRLFWIGGERGLVRDVESWFDYLAKRNLTSHTYNAREAQLVAGILDRFAEDARHLLNRLGAIDD